MMKKILKMIYRLIPFKKELYSFLRAFWKPPRSIYQHLYFWDVFKVKVEDKNFKVRHHGEEVENGLFWEGIEGCWERRSISLWIELCKGSDTILDIGANTGIYALIAKALNPNAKVYAFEPERSNFAKLKSNCEINGYDIRCLEMAVSNYDGAARIFPASRIHTYTFTIDKDPSSLSSKAFEQEIDTIRLSTFIEKNRIAKIDLIKIDVETHEAEVLEGMGDHLYKMMPTMLIEVLNDDIGQRVEGILKYINYLYYNIDEKRSIRQVEHIKKSDYLNYLVCDEKTADKLQLL